MDKLYISTTHKTTSHSITSHYTIYTGSISQYKQISSELNFSAQYISSVDYLQLEVIKLLNKYYGISMSEYALIDWEMLIYLYWGTSVSMATMLLLD